MLLGNFAQWDGFAHAGARVQDVDLALFPLDRVEQTVEVVEIGRVAAHADHVPANQLDGLVERLLPPARDKNIGAFFDEPLGARQRHAARSTRDDCNLTLKPSHDFSFQAPSLARPGRPPTTSRWVRRRQALSAEVRTSVVRNRSGWTTDASRDDQCPPFGVGRLSAWAMIIAPRHPHT